MKKGFHLTLIVLCSLFIVNCDTNNNPTVTPTYTVTFETNGGSDIDQQVIAEGGTIIQPSNPTKADNSFAGWYKETTLATLWNFTQDTVTADTTLYAKWNPVPGGSFAVTFNSNGGTIIQDQVIATGGLVTRPTVTKQGSFLDGWYTEENFTTKWNFAVDTVTQAITLYAKWTPSAPAAVTITINPDNGSPITTLSLNYNSALPATYFVVSGTPGANVPADKTGYRFTGWKNGNANITNTTRFTQDADLTAVWAWQVTVKFALGQTDNEDNTHTTVTGTAPADVVIDNGTALGTSRYPTPQGMTLPTLTDTYKEWEFGGWFNNNIRYDAADRITVVEPVSEFTLTAKWQIKDNNIYPQNPAIHPGNHFVEKYPDGTMNVTVNTPFQITGLFANVESGAGVLSATWYRAATPTGGATEGTVVGTQTGTSHELALTITGLTEPAAGTFYYWVTVTNTNENATTANKTSTSVTQNRLKVVVTGS